MTDDTIIVPQRVLQREMASFRLMLANNPTRTFAVVDGDGEVIFYASGAKNALNTDDKQVYGSDDVKLIDDFQ